MFKVSFSVPQFILNPQKFHKTLRNNLQIRIRQAARAFVKAAIVKIPVDTGEARGTFLPLGRFLNVAVPIGGEPRRGKSAQTGSSPNKQLLFTFGSEELGEYFEIDWQLFHFWFNDFFTHHYPKGQLPTPWGSIEAGKQAFMEYMKTEAPRLMPRLNEFIEVRRFKV